MEGVVRRGPTEDFRIDTYANLLYKGGRKEEAIFWEEKALKVAIGNRDANSSKLYQLTIDKMKTGEPTWVKST